MSKTEDEKIMLARIDENVKTLVSQSTDHEKRIRGLEKWQWKLAGALAFITTAALVYEAFHH